MVSYPAQPGARAGVLYLFAHGAGAGEASPFMVRYARALAERGIDVVTFNFPYMESGRKAPDRAPVLEEAFRRAVVEAAARFPDHRLVIGGKSMGGRIATHLAAQAEAWPADAPPLAGVIVFGYPLQPPGGPSKTSPDRVSHLFRLSVPTLIVQGTRDTFGGPEAITTALKGQATSIEVLSVEGADHSLATRSKATAAASDERVWQRVVAWIRGASGASGASGA
jgi:predicted alpha/beta-hydrolase family hydrolase